jgi:nicotinate-nucleotide--dimethylbenzimidazole phosphoribosyltransferase
MGIGNTTPSSALVAAYTKQAVERVIGRGTGIDDALLENKIAVVKRALALHKPDVSNPLDVLTKLGGFEHGAIAGLMLCAAAHRVPVVLDGFIVGAAALLAHAFSEDVTAYLIPAHCSAEPGHRALLQYLALEPLLDLDLRLGEGTGAVLGMALAELAARILSEMATFEEAAVSEALREDIG